MSISYIKIAYKLGAAEIGYDVIEVNRVEHVSAAAWRRPAPMSGLMARAQ